MRVERLRKLYPVSKGLFTRARNFIHAVDDISFEIKKGEVFGLIGESGCGKTTTGKLLVKLTDPTEGHIYLRDQERYPLVVTQGDRAIGAIALRAPDGLGKFTPKQMTLVDVAVPGENDRRRFLALLQQLRQQGRSEPSGRAQGVILRAEIGDSVYSLVTPEYALAHNVQLDPLIPELQRLYYGDIATLEGTRLKNFRRNVQMIFQDPYESLNPRMTIFDIVNEPLAVQGIGSLVEREERVAEMLEHVGLTPATSFMFRFPHELSGGQRQRVAIARAMILNPSFIVADEPTSMLDVSIRIGVMNLMLELREEFGISYLYITHDLAVARYMCDRIAVMYLGKIVEMGPTEEVIQNPLHPYTRALISAVPIPDPTMRRQPIELKGSVTKPIDPPPRCRFYERCPLATHRCASSDHPPLEDKGNGHWVACYEVG
ncbi:MAG: ABC transporter ATP-binding protein [Candidatus Bipolaricaulota bacterium]|nr:ABC transporter ATP-binding protein [Candidatus Bipolaricaulota bacterium]MCS7275100.1 ABC transporter ATP-binding protein [Candidatus Bipolaricaulota bacterium]MDW8329720.1 ABC transporter ATP-binding protein [Candidatus Bipolaricaulota bacterium]